MVELRANPDALALDVERTLVVDDPVCGKQIDLDRVAAQEDHEGWAYFFCSPQCHRRFTANPRRFAGFRPLEKTGVTQ